ncbi:MAG: response regulator [Flavisolibacter sp.]
MSSNSNHKHVILYAEDDADDLFMVQQALEKFDHTIHLTHAINGFDAIRQLNELHDAKSLPCLVILDINMPGMDGKETLIRIRQNEAFLKLKVVLFTTSSGDLDKSFAKKWGAEFITKPIVYSELEVLARTFLAFCTSTVSQHA